MKLNWGKGIFLSFIVFALIMAYIVIFPFNQKVELVTDNYYEKEIKYQEQIDKQERTALLSESLSVTNDLKELKITFPPSYQNVTGEILFYRPADAKKDFSLPISADSSGSQLIDISPLIPGYWKIKILWSMNGTHYYYEKNIMI
jgi:hypothetical protein